MFLFFKKDFKTNSKWLFENNQSQNVVRAKKIYHSPYSLAVKPN